MRVTIKDIAQKSGFSISTVSQVLNDNKSARISEKTCRAILSIAKEMNYVPNLQAVSLIKRRSGTLGLIVPDIANHFFCTLAKGVEAAASVKGCNTFFCNTDDDPEKDIYYVKKMIERNVDGVIIAKAGNNSSSSVEQCIRLAECHRVPIVFVDRFVSYPGAVSVYTDHESGGYLATKHLIELGHKRIACMTGYMGLESSKQRFFGYLRALQEEGITFDHNLVVEGDFHFEAGYNMAEQLLNHGVTAIFACNDLMAFGIYVRTLELGLKIPGDLSLVGYDNITQGIYSMYSLTTINQEVAGLGRQAVDTILQMIEEPEKPVESVVLKPTLITRDSTAPMK